MVTQYQLAIVHWKLAGRQMELECSEWVLTVKQLSHYQQSKPADYLLIDDVVGAVQ